MSYRTAVYYSQVVETTRQEVITQPIIPRRRRGKFEVLKDPKTNSNDL